MDITFDDLNIKGFTTGCASKLVEVIRNFEKLGDIHRLVFKPEWCGRTDYFDGMTQGEHQHQLKTGEMAYFHTGHISNQLAIIIGTRFGNVIFFTRFTNGELGAVVAAVPNEINKLGLILSGPITEIELFTHVGKFYGTHKDNVGLRIEAFLAEGDGYAES